MRIVRARALALFTATNRQTHRSRAAEQLPLVIRPGADNSLRALFRKYRIKSELSSDRMLPSRRVIVKKERPPCLGQARRLETRATCVARWCRVRPDTRSVALPGRSTPRRRANDRPALPLSRLMVTNQQGRQNRSAAQGRTTAAV